MAELSEKEKSAFMRAAPRLRETWKISDQEAQKLLALSEFEWARLKKGRGGNLNQDQFQRIGALVGLHVALTLIFSGDVNRLPGWLRAENTGPVTRGRTALEVMIEGGLPAIQRISGLLHAEANS